VILLDGNEVEYIDGCRRALGEPGPAALVYKLRDFLLSGAGEVL
jgi:hypothetical protein